MLKVKLYWGLPEKYRLQVAAMLYDTFEQKYMHLFGPRSLAVPFFVTQLVPRYALLAINSGTLVGMAAAKTSAGELLRIRFLPWIQTYRLRAFRSFVIGAPFYFERSERGILTLTSLAVSPSFRRQGIGTMMINEFLRVGRKNGYHAVRLEVINSNVQAKKLYERLGFTTIRYSVVPDPWNRWLGFSGKYEMEYRLT